MNILDKVKKHPLPSHFRPCLLTLTIRNMPDLRKGIHDLLHYFRNLRHTRWWKSSFAAGAYTIEITRGRDGNWHPHIHALVWIKFIDLRQLNYQWSRIVADPAGSSRCNAEFIQSDAVERAVAYVTSYITKSEFPMADLAYVNQATRSIHLCNILGWWRKTAWKLPKHVALCPNCKSPHLDFNFMSSEIISVPELNSLSPPLDPAAFPYFPPIVLRYVNDALLRRQKKLSRSPVDAKAA
jgi:hypothetical protein